MATDYNILRKETTSIILPGGVVTDGYRIWFEVPATHTVDKVDVPTEDDDPRTIKTLIQAKVEKILDLFSSE